ncbi:MAG: hypothetical protein LBJ15_00760 [Comamonas sp.]|uniref:hypothetical protein n=1 Tax=Comamonas sp. TaxID=34028 RepID=UPI002835A90D|nr:hypothetical protein [Comamonas sp.]MDR0212517.1 hypothetical protein [Comamonas sp.]
MAAISGPQLDQAISEGINMGAGRAKNAMRAEMQSVFDRPTPYILNAVQVQKKAVATDLTAMVAPTYMGGKGVDPQKILAAQEEGGRRQDKRSEVALRRAGILPRGYQTAIPATPFVGSDDGRGNLRGAFLVQLISYFQAFGEQGHRANMTAKRKQAIHLRGGKGAKFVGPVRGHRFFVAYGSARGGARWTAKGENDRRASSLAPGIWAATGTGGVDVRPVLMFVKTASYTPRISLEQVRQRSGVDELVPKWIRGRIYEAAKRAGR